LAVLSGSGGFELLQAVAGDAGSQPGAAAAEGAQGEQRSDNEAAGCRSFPQGRIEASFHLLQRERKAMYNG
jgi:hypothetical protein